MDTPLSVVKIILVLLFLSSFIALASSFEILDWGGFKMVLVSPLSSSASPCFSCWHTFSTAAIYSVIGGCLSTTAKFGLWANTCSWASVSGVLEIFLTQVWVIGLGPESSVTLAVELWMFKSDGTFWSWNVWVAMSAMFDVWATTCVSLAQSLKLWFLVFYCLEMTRFPFYLDKFFIFLHSFSSIILSNILISRTLHVSLCYMIMVMELLINLTLSLSRSLSVFLII